MMGHQEKKRGGDEWDLLGKIRRIFSKRFRSQSHNVKQRFSRRIRRSQKQEAGHEADG